MSVHALPGDHLRLVCDTPECPSEIVAQVDEHELLQRAEVAGWNIDREFGLHYCALMT
jgi:hypothetical protein